MGDDGTGGRGRKAFDENRLDREKDVDLVELNEAFAVAAIAVTRQLNSTRKK